MAGHDDEVVDSRRSPERHLLKRSEPIPKGTVSELIDWCIHRGVDPNDVQVSGGGHLSWASLESEDERDRRLATWQAADERHEKWEQETWARLSQVYGVRMAETGGTVTGIASPRRSKQ